MILAPLASVQVNAIIALLTAVALIPLAGVCLALYLAGRTFTPGDKRSTMGVSLGRWLLSLGLFMIFSCISLFSRWIDLDADMGPIMLVTVARVGGLLTVISTLFHTIQLAPMLYDRFRRNAV